MDFYVHNVSPIDIKFGSKNIYFLKLPWQLYALPLT